MIPGAVLVALFGIALVRFFRHLPGPTRRRLLAAGILSHAIGLELVGGSYYSAVHGELNMSDVLMATIVGALEMVGAAVLLCGLLAYIPAILRGADCRVRVTAVN